MQEVVEFIDKNLVSKTYEQAKYKKFNFWNSQPVPKLEETIKEEGIIKTINSSEVSQEPLELPEDFEWIDINIENEQERQQVCNFLQKYYIEDDNNEFRLLYTEDFLKWVFDRPNKEFTICKGVIVKKNEVLVGFISGQLGRTQINKTQLETAEVDFLCVHPKLRKKQLASVLIKEITRVFELKGIKQAIFTSARYVPKPFFTAQYFHRPLNMEVLLETGFSKKPEKTPIESLIKYFRLPSKNSSNFKIMEELDIEGAFKKLESYMVRYNCHHVFSMEEFTKLFFNNKFVTACVMLNDEGQVQDFISYYYLPSKVLKNNSKHELIKTAYLYYYSSTVETAYQLIKELLILAKKNGIDVMNALDIMENKEILKELNFEPGTGNLNYYFYNWRTRDLNANQICKILV